MINFQLCEAVLDVAHVVQHRKGAVVADRLTGVLEPLPEFVRLDSAASDGCALDVNMDL